MSNEQEGVLNRRQFVAAAAAACAACWCGGPALAKENGVLECGVLGDYPADGIYDKFARRGVFIVRHEGRLYAMHARCTHKGGRLRRNGDDQLKCPEHGAEFSIQGTPTKEPASVSLPRFAIAADANGAVRVDTDREFGERQWDDPAAFVKLSPS